jgi:hypothetical protein
MTPPPTSIDGTDITGATIDGQDVQEITVDGQTVFVAETNPIEYSSMIAWYPFDSSFYGGNNADDCTALFNPGESGDSTSYDGAVNGATYETAGGNTDINAGQDSGYFDFRSTNDFIDISGIPNLSQMTFCMWVKAKQSTPPTFRGIAGLAKNNRQAIVHKTNGTIAFKIHNGSTDTTVSTAFPSAEVWHHIAHVWDGSTQRCLIDGVEKDSTAVGNMDSFNDRDRIGERGFNFGSDGFNGDIDDVRIYDKGLTNTQISDIVAATSP